MNYPSYARYPRPIGLARYLDRMPSFGAALAHARESSRQSGLLIDVIPERIRRIVVAVSVSGSTLIITIESTEAAHLIRLIKPELLAKLDQHGLKFNEISFRIQSGRSAARIVPRPAGYSIGQKVHKAANNLKSERLQTSVRKLAQALVDR